MSGSLGQLELPSKDAGRAAAFCHRTHGDGFGPGENGKPAAR
jgi:hypothetical protein